MHVRREAGALRRAAHSGAGLVREQPSLPLEAASIARELSASPDDPMARDDQTDRVPAVRQADSARRRRLSERRGDLAVRARRARRDALHLRPDAALEGSPARLDRDVRERDMITAQVRPQPAGEARRVRGAPEHDGAIPRRQRAVKARRAVGELERVNRAAPGHEQQGPDRRLDLIQ